MFHNETFLCYTVFTCTAGLPPNKALASHKASAFVVLPRPRSRLPTLHTTQQRVERPGVGYGHSGQRIHDSQQVVGLSVVYVQYQHRPLLRRGILPQVAVNDD